MRRREDGERRCEKVGGSAVVLAWDGLEQQSPLLRAAVRAPLVHPHLEGKVR